MKKGFKSIPIEPEIWREMSLEKVHSGRDLYVIVRDLWEKHRGGNRSNALLEEEQRSVTLETPLSPYQKKLDFILNSGRSDAISAVTQNIDVFYKYAGGQEVPPDVSTSPAAKRKRHPKGARSGR